MNGQTRQRKGKVTASPRAKAKVNARARENIHIKRQRVEFVGDVQENDDFECPRSDRAAHVFCAQECNSVTMDSTELPSSSKRVSDGSEEPAGSHEKFDQSTGEVLFAVGCRDDRPLVDSGSVVSTCPVDYATSVPTEKYNTVWRVCWVNLCNITASSAMFFSPTDLAAA